MPEKKEQQTVAMPVGDQLERVRLEHQLGVALERLEHLGDEQPPVHLVDDGSRSLRVFLSS